jgi:hypothetical protein
MNVTICKQLASLALLLMLGTAGTPLFSEVQSAWAGPGPPGHTHDEGELQQKEIIERSKAYLRRLVVNGKIEPSWESLEPATVGKQTYKDRKEWVITFENPEVNSEDKKTLFMFFTLNGQVVAANFSGD